MAYHNVRLSEREVEILQWLTAGKSAWEIGKILEISQRTVEWYIRLSNQKFNSVNTVQTVSKALHFGLIKPILFWATGTLMVRRLIDFDGIVDGIFVGASYFADGSLSLFI